MRCCICINIGKGEASRTPADTIVAGYAVCAEHTELMEHRDLNFLGMIDAAKAQRRKKPL